MRVKSYTIDLSEQMAVCDANYIRLLKLLGNTRSLSQRIVALPHLGKCGNKEQVSVSLEVLEDFKYTSTISVRQLLRNREIKTNDRNVNDGFNKNNKNDETNETHEVNSAYYNAPEMIIRVYHDAKTAEVTSYQNHRYFKAVYPVPNQFMYQTDEKEQLNLFLAEWLNLCINEGLTNPDELKLNNLTCL